MNYVETPAPFSMTPLMSLAQESWERLPFWAVCFAVIIFLFLLISFVGAIVAMLKGPITERHLKGVRLVSWKHLAKMTRYKKKETRDLQIMLGEVPWPEELETRHLLIAGTTGAGKSTLIRQILPKIRLRGGRAIIMDLNGDLSRKFYAKGDKIFNPLDRASICWNPLAEISEPKDVDTLVRAMIPKGASTDEETWRGYARDFLKTILLRLREVGELRMDRLTHYTATAGDKDLAAFLQGGAKPSRLQENSMVSTTKSVVKVFVQALNCAPAQSNFSIADWVRNGTGFIFITPREDERQGLMPLIDTFMNLAVKGALSPAQGKTNQPIALVIDELSSFDFDDLQGVLEKGRKYGLVAYAGIQNVAQLRQKYGPDGSKVLMSCFSSKVIFNPGDAETARLMADEIGEHVVERMETSNTKNVKSGSSSTKSWRQCAPAHLILPSELRSLPALHAYLRFTGNFPVAKITVRY
jgi:type IV secretory pathway TraG/TraD family ATPase VirD4